MLEIQEQDTHDPLLSTLTDSDKEIVNKKRSLKSLQRLFQPMNSGSMRGVIIMWVRMTLGIGILTLPKYVMIYGAVLGVIFIFISALINYWAYVTILRGTYYTGKKQYPGLIEDLLGKRIFAIFRITYMLDISSSIMLYSIVSWNLFEFCMHFFGFSQKEWILDPQTLVFDETNPQLSNIRYIFFGIIFIITIPLFLKKSMDSLQAFTIMFLLILLFLLIWILAELPFFLQNFQNNKIDVQRQYFKKPQMDWPENIFGLLIGFYVQPYIFSLRDELLLPTLRRTIKVSRVSVVFECILFSLIGFCGYFVFGDKYTPEIFILRAPYKGKNVVSEKIFQVLICFFFLLNTLGLAIYNTSIRDYLSEFCNIKKSRLKYVIASLLPFGLICTLSAIYPQVINVLNFFGYTIYNFNGYIIPFLMGIQICKRYPKNFGFFVKFSYYLLLILFVCLGIFSISYKCYTMFFQFNQIFQQSK